LERGEAALLVAEQGVGDEPTAAPSEAPGFALAPPSKAATWPSKAPTWSSTALTSPTQRCLAADAEQAGTSPASRVLPRAAEVACRLVCPCLGGRRTDRASERSMESETAEMASAVLVGRHGGRDELSLSPGARK
jgi:hypothetical protein